MQVRVLLGVLGSGVRAKPEPACAHGHVTGEDAPSGGRGTMDNRRPETAQSGSTRASPGTNPGFPVNGGMAELG